MYNVHVCEILERKEWVCVYILYMYMNFCKITYKIVHEKYKVYLEKETYRYVYIYIEWSCKFRWRSGYCIYYHIMDFMYTMNRQNQKVREKNKKMDYWGFRQFWPQILVIPLDLTHQ